MAPPLIRGLGFLLATLALLQVSYGAVQNVGDAAGWTAMGGVDYAKWASSRSFRVGDALVFNYNNQFHNVKQVSHHDFVSCNATSPIAVYTTGHDSVSLKSPGHNYFLCGFPGHCERGQKLDILAEPSAIRGPTASPSPAPSSSASSMPPSSPSTTSGSVSSHPHLAFAVFASCLLLAPRGF